ncbi:LOW QUALITY PROTEIN: protocadherin gamma-C5-like [Rhinophrynus dorsalis]
MDFKSTLKAWRWQVVYSFFLCSWGWVSGQLRYSVVEESEPGTVVGNVAQDLGLNLADLSKRRLHFGSEGSRRHFTVNQGNGALSVKERIDRESLCGSSTSCLLYVEIVIENPLELFSLEIEILDINDNSPIFSTTNHVIKITELLESPGGQFPLEIAQDPDVGVNGVSRYTLNPTIFFIVCEESKRWNSYSTVDINDNAPVFDQSIYKISLQENIPLKTVIIILNATDLDEGSNSEIEYSFGDHTSVAAKHIFGLNSETGEIYINDEVDFEKSNFYELSIKANDKGVPKLERHCLIQVEIEDVNDNNPEIIFSSLTSEIPENAALGTVVGFLSVKDHDSGKNGEVKLELLQNLPFKFKEFKNRYSLVTDGYLDREKVSQYIIDVIASDLGSPPLHTQALIILNVSDINDNTPTFLQTSYSAFITENNEPGYLLCKVSAYDSDEGINAELIYSVVDSTIDGSSVLSFVYIGSNDGNIYAQHSFDYEHMQVLQITILVEDSGSPKLFSNVSVYLFILDANDNYPKILYPESSKDNVAQESIPKSASIGYLVTKLSAVDFDSGHNAWLLYNITETSSPTLFKLSAYTGEVRTIRSIQETDNYKQELIISHQT